MSRNGDSARARRASRRHGNPDVVAKAQAQPEPEPNVFSRLPLEAIHVRALARAPSTLPPRSPGFRT